MKLILDKLTYSILGGLIGFVICNPATYQMTNSIFEGGVANQEGCPTDKGVLIHTVLFFLIIFGVMLLFNYFKDPMEKKDYNQFLMRSIFSALLFFFITSSVMYNTTNKVVDCFGLPTLVQQPGCANMTGSVVHSVIFALLLFLLMR